MLNFYLQLLSGKFGLEVGKLDLLSTQYQVLECTLSTLLRRVE